MYKVIQHIVTQMGRFEIVRDTIEKGEKTYPYSYVKVKPGITVVPFFNQEQVLLLKEYRHTIQKYVYEFPSGFIDELETPEQAVYRELKEETGFEPKQINSLGAYYPSFGSTDEITHLFSCNIDADYSECKEIIDSCNKREPLEEISIEIMSIKEVNQLIESGVFMHGSGIIAWYRFFNQCRGLR